MPYKRKNKDANLYITMEELHSFFIHAFKDLYDFRFKVFFYLLAVTGRRNGEICKLHVTDFEDDFKRVNVTNFKNNGRIESFPIPEPLTKILKIWILQNMGRIEESGGWLFPHTNKNHLHMPEVSANNWMRKKRNTPSVIKHLPFLLDVAFIKTYNRARPSNLYQFKFNQDQVHRFTTHSLRRLMATTAYEKTKDIIIAQIILGHEDISTTQAYINYHLHFQKKIKILQELYTETYCRIFNQEVMNPAQTTLTSF